MKVFLIEDDVRYRKFLTKLLSDKFGFEVSAGDNNMSGLKSCVAFQPELIFIDVSLPALTGEGSLKKLKSIKEFHATPVIVLTSNIEKSVAARLIKMGVKDFLMKIYERDETYFRLKKILQSIGLMEEPQTETAEPAVRTEDSEEPSFFKEHQTTLRNALQESAAEAFGQLTSGKVSFPDVKGLSKLHDHIMTRTILNIEEADIDLSVALVGSKGAIRYMAHSLGKDKKDKPEEGGIEFFKAINRKLAVEFLSKIQAAGIKAQKSGEAIDADPDSFLSKRWKVSLFPATESNLIFYAGIISD